MVTLSQIAQRIDGTLSGDPDKWIVGINALEHATEQELSFVHQSRYIAKAKQSQAGALLVSDWIPDLTCPQIRCPSPYLAMAQVSQWLFPPEPLVPGISAQSVIDPTAKVHPSACVEAFAIISAEAVVGPHCHIMGHAVIGRNVQMGQGCKIHPHAVLYDDILLGQRVTIHSGAIIGADGFGYALDPTSQQRYKIPQRGNVILEDDVEIGANTTIDRATFGSTIVQIGCKIDNQVQLGHNVTIGGHSVIASQTGVAGSTTVGAHATIGAQVGINGHITLCDRVYLAGRTGVVHPIREPGVYGGLPATHHRRWLRCASISQHLPELRERVRQLEQHVQTSPLSSQADG